MKQVLLLTIAFIFFSCDKEDAVITQESVAINVQVYYKTRELINIEKPDSGAVVYVYYGIDERDIIFYDFEYQKGILTKNEVSVYPDQRAVANKNGFVPSFPPMYSDRKVLIITESFFYKNKLASASWTSSNDSISLKNVFGPFPDIK
jgi:hypothetical protein